LSDTEGWRSGLTHSTYALIFLHLRTHFSDLRPSRSAEVSFSHSLTANLPPKRDLETSHIDAGGGYISHAHKEYKNRLGDQIVVFWEGSLSGKGSYKKEVYKWEGGSHINTSAASKYLFSGKTHRRAEDTVDKREATDDVSSGIADLRMISPCEGADEWKLCVFGNRLSFHKKNNPVLCYSN